MQEETVFLRGKVVTSPQPIGLGKGRGSFKEIINEERMELKNADMSGQLGTPVLKTLNKKGDDSGTVLAKHIQKKDN